MGKKKKVKAKMMSEPVDLVEIEKISLNPFQPRKQFAEESIEELAQSIRSCGLIHPLLVRRMSEAGYYELIAGERRLRACRLAGLTAVPAMVAPSSPQFSLEAALIENIQREDLNPLEIAKALKRMLVECGLRQEALAARVGKKRSTVANYLRLLLLPEEIQQGLASGKMSMGHAKAVLALESQELQLLLHNKIVQEGLSVREAEHAAKQLLQERPKSKKIQPSANCFLEDLEERIRKRLGTAVTISCKGDKGKICIDYYSLDDLDRILEMLGCSVA